MKKGGKNEGETKVVKVAKREKTMMRMAVGMRLSVVVRGVLLIR